MKKSIIAIALIASAVSMLSSCVVPGPGYYGGRGYGYHHPHGGYGYHRGW